MNATLSMIVSLVGMSAIAAAGPSTEALRATVTVPVRYDEQAAIIASKDGVAIVRFTSSITDGFKRGSAYEFRYRPAGTSVEQRGTGEVYENREYLPPIPKPGDSMAVVDHGSSLELKAGSFSLEWSRRDKSSGWIYFVPERERVELVNARTFDELDLQRFAPLASRGELTPSTQPSIKYRLRRQLVAGLAPPQWVFIIVTPEGDPWVATEAKLRRMIEQAVPANATLEWAPGSKKMGGEPLETVEELDALKAFCLERKVNFVHLPGW